MIPHQPLRDRKREPIPFLAWAAADAVPPDQFQAYADTAAQLLETFFHVANAYGLRLEAETPAELEAWSRETPGSTLVRPPSIYLACADQDGDYLAFDWAAWLDHSGYLLNG